MICRCQIMNSKHSQHITSTAAQAPSHGGGRRAPAALGGIPWGGVRAAVYPAASTGFDVHVALRIGLTMKSGSAAPGRCRARPDADGHPKPPGMPTLSCWSSSETGALHPPAQAEAPPGGRRLPARGASLWGSACIWARVRDHIRQARGPGPGDDPDPGRVPSGTPTPATRALGCLMSAQVAMAIPARAAPGCQCARAPAGRARCICEFETTAPPSAMGHLCRQRLTSVVRPGVRCFWKRRPGAQSPRT